MELQLLIQRINVEEQDECRQTANPSAQIRPKSILLQVKPGKSEGNDAEGQGQSHNYSQPQEPPLAILDFVQRKRECLGAAVDVCNCRLTYGGWVAATLV